MTYDYYCDERTRLRLVLDDAYKRGDIYLEMDVKVRLQELEEAYDKDPE